jgi:NAD(P)-dependent dehydrogenase (short-subunit alcohol dehydrogenase family)
VVLAVRDLDRGKAAVARLSALVPGADVSLQRLDLGSLSSVRDAAAALRDRLDRIDLLINNAGVALPTRSRTPDGFDSQFGINHLGHFALTGLLLDRLLPVPGSRVVAVSSVAEKFGARVRFDDPHFERGRFGFIAAYGQSKVANLMFTYELQRRLALAGAPTIAVAAHPGAAATEFLRNLPAPMRLGNRLVGRFVNQPAGMGALPTLRAATDPSVAGGAYFGPGGFGEVKGHPKQVRSSATSHDPEAQRRLWTLSESLTGVAYPV